MRVEYAKLFSGKLWPVASCANTEGLEIAKPHREANNAKDNDEDSKSNP